jgi:hypothetical protein
VLLLFLTTTMVTTFLSSVLELLFAAVCESTVYLIYVIEGIVKMLGLLLQPTLKETLCQIWTFAKTKIVIKELLKNQR